MLVLKRNPNHSSNTRIILLLAVIGRICLPVDVSSQGGNPICLIKTRHRAPLCHVRIGAGEIFPQLKMFYATKLEKVHSTSTPRQFFLPFWQRFHTTWRSSLDHGPRSWQCGQHSSVPVLERGKRRWFACSGPSPSPNFPPQGWLWSQCFQRTELPSS